MRSRITRAASSTSIEAIPSPPFPISSRRCGSIRCYGNSTSIFWVRRIWSPASTTSGGAFKERIHLAPKTDLSRAFLAVALGHLGEAEEAKRVWRELMEINPKYSFAEHLGRLPFPNPTDADRLGEGLLKAGIAL